MVRAGDAVASSDGSAALHHRLAKSAALPLNAKWGMGMGMGKWEMGMGKFEMQYANCETGAARWETEIRNGEMGNEDRVRRDGKWRSGTTKWVTAIGNGEIGNGDREWWKC